MARKTRIDGICHLMAKVADTSAYDIERKLYEWGIATKRDFMSRTTETEIVIDDGIPTAPSYLKTMRPI